MNNLKKLQVTTLVSLSLLLLTSPVFAAAPDGLGPWGDTVFSSSQGLMKNGFSVPPIRSNALSTLGVAENNTVEGNFFSLGFGGNIAIGFDNGISSGAIIVEATNPGYPGESAKVEMSEDGITWVMAGNVTQDGTVDKPEGLSCARYVRLTDTSDPENFSDDTADGFDVDGVQATGELCNTPTPTPSPTQTPAPSSTPAPTNPPASSTPGACTSSGITTIPNIISANRTSPTSIFVSWGPNAGLNDFIVEYGFVNGNWQFNTKVSGFSTTINSLPANQPVWIRVAATDNCAIGVFGTPVLVGGNALTNIPGFPNTGGGAPRFPNTGFGPQNDNLLKIILVALPIGLIALSLKTVVLKLRKGNENR